MQKMKRAYVRRSQRTGTARTNSWGMKTAGGRVGGTEGAGRKQI